jgi:hypothetical protein
MTSADLAFGHERCSKTPHMHSGEPAQYVAGPLDAEATKASVRDSVMASRLGLALPRPQGEPPARTAEAVEQPRGSRKLPGRRACPERWPLAVGPLQVAPAARDRDSCGKAVAAIPTRGQMSSVST